MSTRRPVKPDDHRRGSKKCTHGVSPRFCAKCALSGAGGEGLCKHGNNKYYCITCGTGVMCKHGHRRKKCETCATQLQSVMHQTIRKDARISDEDEQRKIRCATLEQMTTLVSLLLPIDAYVVEDMWDFDVNLSPPSFDDMLVDALLSSHPRSTLRHSGCPESERRPLDSWTFSPISHTSCLREACGR